jgi:membrane-associated phospholipid phosphatase
MVAVLGPDALAPLALLVALFVVSGALSAPLALAGHGRRFLEEQWRAARLWTGFVLVYVAYRALANLLPRFVDGGVEDRLRHLDELLFGLSPSWWMERFANPWLTDLFAFAYGLMFVLPLALLLLLQARRRWEEMRALTRCLVLAFALGFVGYVLVPARSPRLAYDYATQLHGHGLYEASEWAWDHLQVMTYDAFPSLHTAVSTISLVWARRVAPRWLFWAYVPAVILLQLATLYLRQHYFVDVAAGWALAALVVRLCA